MRPSIRGAVLASVVAFSCVGVVEEEATLDSGNHVDGGGAFDAGAHDEKPDAGTALDAGPTVDSGSTPDGGLVPDAGITVDSGTTPDGGTTRDGGPVRDAGAPPDSGTAADAGSDSGTADDAGSSRDAGPPPVPGAPRVLYTDVVTGPNSGGEGGNGIYLSIFGVGFGSDLSKVKVHVGSNEVPKYVFLGPSRGRADIQQLSVQLGPTNATGPIKVTRDGLESNTDQTFTVGAGRIFYVSNGTGHTASGDAIAAGNDSTGVVGDITHPFRKPDTLLDAAQPGDVVVVRGGTWADAANAVNAEFGFHNVTGTAAGPITLMGYPGEEVLIVRTAGNHIAAGVNSYNSSSRISYINVSNLHVDMAGGGSSGIGVGAATSYARVVNNEVEGQFENSGGAAAVDGSGSHLRILGNHIHHNGGSKLYHGIYIDSRDTAGPDDIELAFNDVHHQVGGRGIQIYGDTSALITNVHIHHNVIHHIHLDGIVLSLNSGTGFQVFDNIIHHTADPSLVHPTGDDGEGGSCLRFNGTPYGGNTPVLTVTVFNNTFADCAVGMSPYSAPLEFDAAASVTLRNNIFVNGTSVNAYWVVGGALPATLTASNNLWSGGGPAPSLDANAQQGDPLFVDAAAGDYHVQPQSPAVDHGTNLVQPLVTDDHEGRPRPVGAGYDIGAFER